MCEFKHLQDAQTFARDKAAHNFEGARLFVERR